MTDGPLQQAIAREIAVDGPMPLDRFWSRAMTDPEHGYYAAGQPIGEAGDFTTAPEISQIFGELIGLWLVETWQALGAPNPFLLVEFGPGRGQLIADALRAAGAASPEFTAGARLLLVEASQPFRAQQAERLKAYDPAWADDWRGAVAAEPDLPLFAVANEFLDALPIRQFARVQDTWRERLVAETDDGFHFAHGPETELPAGAAISDLGSPPEGAILEYAPERAAFADGLGRRLADSDGAALIVDYGHGASRYGDSLQALADGKPSDPLAAPGAADLTSHVDFARLRAVAEVAGARAWGPIDQGVFLLRLGAEQRAAALAANADAAGQAAVAQALRRLTHPLAMGTLFKAMALLPAIHLPPAGFEE